MTTNLTLLRGLKIALYRTSPFYFTLTVIIANHVTCNSKGNHFVNRPSRSHGYRSQYQCCDSSEPKLLNSTGKKAGMDVSLKGQTLFLSSHFSTTCFYNLIEI